VPVVVITPPESPVPAVTEVTVPPAADDARRVPSAVTDSPVPKINPPVGVETL